MTTDDRERQTDAETLRLEAELQQAMRFTGDSRARAALEEAKLIEQRVWHSFVRGVIFLFAMSIGACWHYNVTPRAPEPPMEQCDHMCRPREVARWTEGPPATCECAHRGE